MTASLLQLPRPLVVDANGTPRAGARLFVYLAGTSTPTTVYQDSALTIPHASPILANSDGTFPPIYADSASNDIKVDLKNSDGTSVSGYPVDDVPLIDKFPPTDSEIAAGITPANSAYAPGDVRRYGVIGDGVTDDSAAFQMAINANKGRLIYVPFGLTPRVAGIALVGSDYNGTMIRVDGELLLSPSGASGTTNYKSGGGVGIGAYVGVAFENCSNCSFEGKWHGNRANQPADEHIFCIALSGVTNFRMPTSAFREIRGDGVYLNQVSWNSNGSSGCKNVSIGNVIGYNSADDGRNLMSVIACESLSIGSFDSYQIGGTVNGVLEPGGLDIEPNAGYQACTDISIGALTVRTAGNGGLGIHGQAITNDATRDWCVRRVSIGSATIYSTCTVSCSPLNLQRAREVTAKVVAVSSASSEGASIDFADHLVLDLNVIGFAVGVFLGLTDWVYDSSIDINVKNYSTFGISASGLGRCRVRGRVYASTASTAIPLWFNDNARGPITQSNVQYSVDCPFDGTATQGVDHRSTDLVIGAGTCIRDCDLTGYATFDKQVGFSIATFNVLGRNIANGLTAPPIEGAWVLGDEVTFDQTAFSTAPRARCVTAGIPGNWLTYLAGTTQSTGWGTPTGAAVENNYAGASATLAQTSAAVAKIITTLKGTGLFGP